MHENKPQYHLNHELLLVKYYDAMMMYASIFITITSLKMMILSHLLLLMLSHKCINMRIYAIMMGLLIFMPIVRSALSFMRFVRSRYNQFKRIYLLVTHTFWTAGHSATEYTSGTYIASQVAYFSHLSSTTFIISSCSNSSL